MCDISHNNHKDVIRFQNAVGVSLPCHLVIPAWSSVFCYCCMKRRLLLLLHEAPSFVIVARNTVFCHWCMKYRLLLFLHEALLFVIVAWNTVFCYCWTKHSLLLLLNEAQSFAIAAWSPVICYRFLKHRLLVFCYRWNEAPSFVIACLGNVLWHNRILPL